MSCQLLQLYICLALLCLFLFISKKCLEDIHLITDWFVDFFLLFSLHLKHMISCSLCSMCSAFVHSVWVSAVASPFFLWLTNAAISSSLCHRHWTNPCCCVSSCHVWAVGSSRVCMFESAYASSVVLSVWESLDGSKCITWDMYVRCV